MPLEVEQKYRVASHESVLAKLSSWGASPVETIRQEDHYFRHPVRDFAQTDEALRIRCVGAQNRITYKGPKLDQTTKTRVEEEVALATGSHTRETASRLLQNLGFTPVAQVVKQRTVVSLQREGLAVEIALDSVAELGTFVEIEINIAEEDAGLDHARKVMQKLAEDLELSQVERRGYLDLLLAQM